MSKLEKYVQKGITGFVFVTTLSAGTVALANAHSYFISNTLMASNMADATEMVESYDNSSDLFGKVFSYGGYLAAKNYLEN